MSNLLFTVFTATYNRAHTLGRVYKSLCAQTCRDFEWVIVDDGSTDGTEVLVNDWIKEADFLIRYIHQANAGKHVAFNKGVADASGELFVNFDSDDACIPEALDVLKRYWFDIPEMDRGSFSAVTAVACYADGSVVGDLFPVSPLDGFPTEIRVKYGVSGDKWGFQTTAAWREFPFPVHVGEKFIPEAASLIRIGAKYKTRFVNDVLLIVYEDGGARLSKKITKLRINNPRGTSDYYREYAYERMPWAEKVKAVVNYSRFAFHSGAPVDPLVRGPYPILAACALPLSLAMWLKDKVTNLDKN